MKAVRNKCFKI